MKEKSFEIIIINNNYVITCNNYYSLKLFLFEKEKNIYK